MVAVFWVTSGQLTCSCPCLIWLRALSHVHAHLSAKMDSSARVSGSLAGHIVGCHPLLFSDLWGSVLWAVWSGRSPWPQEWEKCGCLIFLLKQGPAPVASLSRSANQQEPGTQLTLASGGHQTPVASLLWWVTVHCPEVWKGLQECTDELANWKSNQSQRNYLNKDNSDTNTYWMWRCASHSDRHFISSLAQLTEVVTTGTPI